MKVQFTFLIAVAVALLIAGSSHAAIILSPSLTASENFDSLPTTGSTSLDATVAAQSPLSSTGFVGAKTGGNGTTFNLIASDGSRNSGAIYSYGAVDAADRALGTLASGSNIPAFGVEIVNHTGQMLDNLTISFTQENWRSSTSTQNVVAASVSTDQSISSSTFLTAGTGFSAASALDLVGPAPVASNAALDGNDPANQALRSFTFTGLALADDERFFLRFTDINDSGNDAGLAIDNFTVSSAVAVPEPTSMAALAIVGASGIIAHRRRHAAMKAA